MSKELKKKLKGLKTRDGRVNPDKEWVIKSKIDLMNSISNSSLGVNEKVGLKKMNSFIDLFVPKEFLLYARPFAISALAFVIVVGGWVAGVSASQDSLPGDVLWGVKLAGEKTRLVIASVGGSKEKEAGLHLEFASNRAEEIKEVVAKEESSKKVDSINTAVDSLKKSMESASKSLEDAATEGMDGVLAIAANTDKKVDEILGDLKESQKVAKDGGVEDANGINKVENQMKEVSNVVEDMSVKTIGVLVSKTEDKNIEEGVKTEVKEMIKTQVGKHLDKVAEDFNETKQVVQDATNLVASSTFYGVDNNGVQNIVSSSTLSVNTLEIVKDTEQKVVQAGVQIEKTLSEAKDLLNQENVVSAFEKMKEVVGTQKEISAVVVEAVKISGTGVSGTNTTSAIINPITTSATASTTTSTSGSVGTTTIQKL